MNELKDKIKDLRTDKNLTIEALAQKIGYSKSVVYYWENGQRRPNSTALAILSDFFGVSIDYLIGHEEEPKTIKYSPINITGLTEKEQEILTIFRNASESGKNIILGNARNVKKNDPAFKKKEQA